MPGRNPMFSVSSLSLYNSDFLLWSVEALLAQA